uniref:Uncharacterized protein n=1 Tax=Arundo donax TaxID=35708 RepID=A0A0A9B7Z7_ARUDO
MYCSLRTRDRCADCRFARILLTRLGSTAAVETSWPALSPWHSLCASSVSPFSGFSSLKLLWSDGDDELGAGAGATCGGGGGGRSSANMDKSWSSSRRSKSCAPTPALSSGTASRKATESLTERRCAPRLAAEKSRNSSTHDGCCWCWCCGGSGGMGAARNAPTEGLRW